MSAQHTKPTPGTWTVADADENDDGLLLVCVDDGHPGLAVIAIVEDQKEQDANAQLIAAAPDLYQAVKDSLPYLIDVYGPCDPDCGCLVHRLEAAIARAEGRV